MSKKCEHGREKYYCKECGGSGICEHGRQKHKCKDCDGQGICEHGRQKHKCKDCDGQGICEHGRQKHKCKDCGGSAICEHGRQKHTCKECGTHNTFIRNGFTPEQIKEMGVIKTCQFPNCLVQSNGKSLNSDHYHDGNKINPNNYRGEICYGHNMLLASLDRFPEEASAKAQEYMNRRPFQIIKEN
jgi:hypothetical protein